MRKYLTKTKLVICFFMIISYAHAHNGSKGEEQVTQLLSESVPHDPGRKVLMLTVVYKPGQASIPHKHPDLVIAYVLEGSIISQLAGQAPIKYNKGQYWFEPPYTEHIQCKNASNTKPAKILIWQLVNDGSASLIPTKLPNK